MITAFVRPFSAKDEIIAVRAEVVARRHVFDFPSSLSDFE